MKLYSENQKLSNPKDWLLPILISWQVAIGDEERELAIAAVNNTKL